jgi:crotonobetainyl-CoA:carnitine CoA-transferase CaiB-like acyl-CoA transferase
MSLLEGQVVFALEEAAHGALARFLSSAGAEVEPVALQDLSSALQRAHILIDRLGLTALKVLGCSHEHLQAQHPALIHCSVTPFGSGGPRAHWRGSELVASAMGGTLRLTGDPDRAPVKEALDACWFHADMAAAAGTMAALYERGASGLGQHVDVSVQEVAFSRNVNPILVWQFDRRKMERAGGALNYGRATIRCIWPLADGFCFHSLMTGRFGAPANQALSDWMDEVQMANPLRGTDWLKYNRSTLDAATRATWEHAIEAFFRTRTRAEIAEEGRRRGINATVVAEPADVLSDPHLEARNFWQVKDGVRRPSRFVKVTTASRAGSDDSPTANVDGRAQSNDPLRADARAQSNEPPHTDARAQAATSLRDGGPARANVPLRAGTPALASEPSRSDAPAQAGEPVQANDPLRADALTQAQRPEARALRNTQAQADARERSSAQSRSQDRAAHRPEPLAGVRVLDFSWALVGSITTKVLGDWGCDVIKVESRGRPCLSRIDVQVHASRADSFDDKPWFAHLNTSKCSLALDMKNPASREVLEPLIDWADVVVENFSPGTMKKLGLDYAHLAARNPAIVMVSGSVYGQTGPLAEQWGVDGTGAALSGRTFLTGWPDRSPVIPGAVPYGDVIVPYVMAASVAAALQKRRETGVGCHIDAAMYEICVQQMEAAILAAQKGAPLTRSGNDDPNVFHQGLYPALGDDRWVAITLYTKSDWEMLSQHAGLDMQLDRLSEWTAGQLDIVIVEALQKLGIAAGVVQDVQDMIERDQQLSTRHALTTLDHLALGPFGHVRTPVSFSRSTVAPFPAPAIGAHSHQIAAEVCGLPAARIAELDKMKVFR